MVAEIKITPEHKPLYMSETDPQIEMWLRKLDDGKWRATCQGHPNLTVTDDDGQKALDDLEQKMISELKLTPRKSGEE